MKRAAAELEVAASPDVKRLRTLSEDGDSAYVSLGDTTPDAVGSPAASTIHQPEGSVVSTTSTRQRPKIFNCTFFGCTKSFDRQARLDIHIRSHTGEKPFVCQEEGCGKAYPRSEHLKAHVKSKHQDLRDHICDYNLNGSEEGEPKICGKAFHTATKLRNHIAAHKEKEQTKCQHCGQIFRKQETLQRHIRADHLNENAYRCSYVGDEVGAEECGQTFPTAGQLKTHESNEHLGPRYYCQTCVAANKDTDPMEFGWAMYADFQRHMLDVHPPTCGLCGHVAESSKALRAHLEIVHQDLADRQRYPCPHPGCDSKFTRSGNLGVHIRSVHAKIKAFVCGETDLTRTKHLEAFTDDGCGERYGSKAALVHHVRIYHLGEEPEDVYTYRKRKPRNPKQDKANRTISMLTGVDYEKHRPIACLAKDCEDRFKRDYDMSRHVELCHQWTVDDINDAIEERNEAQAEADARNGDKFWIGGYDEMQEAMEAERAQAFRNVPRSAKMVDAETQTK